MVSRTLAEGPGWQVQDAVCTAGPQDRAFEERHETVAIAAVISGAFQYRTEQGSALLSPGAILLGNHGRCFECNHAHGVGDRCISVAFSPGYWDDIVAAVPGARKAEFAAPRVPPTPALISVTAALEAACETGGQALEEAALEFAGAVIIAAGGLANQSRGTKARDQRRISHAVRRIEEMAHDLEAGGQTLARLADETCMSPYHFLRSFRSVVGMTPHQYVLRIRMNRAAVRLRLSDDPVSSIALEAGFNDLSTFNRRFRRVIGVSPSNYRRAGAG